MAKPGVVLKRPVKSDGRFRSMPTCPLILDMKNAAAGPGIDTVATMSEITAGFSARLEYVLDQVCIDAPDGGQQEMHRFVAERLITAAQAGERSLEELTEVARQALVAFSGSSSQGPVEMASSVKYADTLKTTRFAV
jgi:hypothetical protein